MDNNTFKFVLIGAHAKACQKQRLGELTRLDCG